MKKSSAHDMPYRVVMTSYALNGFLVGSVDYLTQTLVLGLVVLQIRAGQIHL